MAARSKQVQPTAAAALKALRALADPEKAAFFPRFFKAGPGEYAEGDRFLGVTVPGVRQTAREAGSMALPEIRKLLESPFNEARLLGFVILVGRYERARDPKDRDSVCRFYLKHRAGANNWNLVDASAPYILGTHLAGGDRSVAYRLARSRSLWDRRIAVVASFAWIRRGEFDDTLRLCELLLDDPHDLIHKACGWMLREIGKRDELALRDFLDRHAAAMPRTMLRYAIEKLGEADRRRYRARDALSG